MDYRKHYDRLIERARNRNLSGYVERHHVVPRCLGGDNSPKNIVRLTAEEHYVAHQLLVKLNPHHLGLAWAVVKMAQQCSGSKAYGWLRRQYANMKRGRPQTAETRAKISAAHFGRPKSLDTRARMSAAQKGRIAPRGWKHSLEARAKMSQACIGSKRGQGKACSAEKRAKISASMKGKNTGPLSAEHRAKISAGMKAHFND